MNWQNHTAWILKGTIPLVLGIAAILAIGIVAQIYAEGIISLRSQEFRTNLKLFGIMAIAAVVISLGFRLFDRIFKK